MTVQDISDDSQNVREYHKFLLYFCYEIVNVRSLFISVCVCVYEKLFDLDSNF